MLLLLFKVKSALRSGANQKMCLGTYLIVMTDFGAGLGLASDCRLAKSYQMRFKFDLAGDHSR
jgi:hypothetical protein